MYVMSHTHTHTQALTRESLRLGVAKFSLFLRDLDFLVKTDGVPGAGVLLLASNWWKNKEVIIVCVVT